jgi:hypothetical protein
VRSDFHFRLIHGKTEKVYFLVLSFRVETEKAIVAKDASGGPVYLGVYGLSAHEEGIGNRRILKAPSWSWHDNPCLVSEVREDGKFEIVPFPYEPEKAALFHDSDFYQDVWDSKKKKAAEVVAE